MARTNNLTNFLTDVSSAIKQKTGDNTPIPASDFDTEILSIETAGNYQSKTLTVTQNGNYNLLPDQDYDAMSNVNISVNVPTGEDLDAVITAQEQKLTQLETILQNKASGGGSEPNIFVQDTEPTIKNGIWLKMSDTEAEHYSYENQVFENEGWSQNTYTPIPYDVSACAIANVGNFIYMFGSAYPGSNQDYPNVYLAYKYDIVNDTYTQLSNVPVEIAHISAVSYGTDIYIIGNATGSGADSCITNYKYNTLTDTYTRLTDLPIQMFFNGLTIIQDNIYMFGGSKNPTKAYKYNITNNTYTQLADIPYSASRLARQCVSVGTNIYLFGGSDTSNYRRYVYKYDTLNNTYTRLADLSYNFNNSSSVAIGTDIYLLGFEDYRTTMYKYDTIQGTYTQLADIPYSAYYTSSIAIDTDIYLFGGYGVWTNRALYSLASKTYLDNTVVINQGKYQSGSHDIVLYNNSKDITPAKYPLKDAYFYTTQDGLDGSMPVYYGDGTQWINIKNPQTEGGNE